MTKTNILDYVMNTPGNTNRAVLDTMLNQLSDGENGSGDGSSDFSTAEVAISIDEGVEIVAYIPLIGATFDGDFEDFESVYAMQLYPGGSYTALVSLFKGKAIVSFDQFNYASATATGGVSLNIEDSIVNGFTVTGDGTITINYVQ